jgi:hypothetical protein
MIEPFEVIGFARLLRDGSVPLRRHHTPVDFLWVRMKRGLLTVYRRDLGPQRLGTLTAAIPDMQCHELASCRVHGDPDPLFRGLRLHNTPHVIGFGFPLPKHDRCWIDGPLDMSMIGTGSKALDHQVPSPR